MKAWTDFMIAPDDKDPVPVREIELAARAANGVIIAHYMGREVSIPANRVYVAPGRLGEVHAIRWNVVQTLPTTCRHLDSLFSDGKISNEELIHLYTSYQPVGSGPLSTMRMVCALIEEIAETRGLKLPFARGVRDMHR